MLRFAESEYQDWRTPFLTNDEISLAIIKRWIAGLVNEKPIDYCLVLPVSWGENARYAFCHSSVPEMPW